METRFIAYQTVELAVVEQAVPIQHYLRQPHRLVQALAVNSQIEHLEAELFRFKMRPLNFMTVTLQPTVDMRVWAEPDGVIRLQSVACEIRGIEYINQRFSLNLVGRLQPRQIHNQTYLKGRADLEVRVVVPPPLGFTPRPLLEATGNSVLKSVLLTIKQRMMHHLLQDYYNWANSASDADLTVPSDLLPSNSPLV
jgi:hypothetical protein